jgi:hypothetical protein
VVRTQPRGGGAERATRPGGEVAVQRSQSNLVGFGFSDEASSPTTLEESRGSGRRLGRTTEVMAWQDDGGVVEDLGDRKAVGGVGGRGVIKHYLGWAATGGAT